MGLHFDRVFGAKFPRPDHSIWQECPELDHSQVFAAVAGAPSNVSFERLYWRPVGQLVADVKAGRMEPGYYLRITGDGLIVLTKIGPRGGDRCVWTFGLAATIRNELFLAGQLDAYKLQATKQPHGFKY